MSKRSPFRASIEKLFNIGTEAFIVRPQFSKTNADILTALDPAAVGSVKY